MKPLRRAWSKLRGLGGRQRQERELADELAGHIEMQTEVNVREGMPPDEARRAAALKFGGLEAAKESYRDQRALPVVETALADLRHALRGIRRSPGFAVVVVLTLALGIAANTAIFSLVNQLLLHPSGIVDPERIVTVGTRYTKLGLHVTWVSGPTLADVRDSRQVFEHAALAMTVNVNYAEGESPQRLQAAGVSVEWFDVFGVQPLLGRVFRPEEDLPNANHEAVLSHAAWTRLFGADRSVLGRSILLDQVPYQVIGVMRPGFRYPNNVDVWVPAGLPPEELAINNRFNEHFIGVARARSGVSFNQANAWMGVLSDRVRNSATAPSRPGGFAPGQYARNAEWGLFADPFTDTVAGNTKTPLLVLMGAVGFVLLIACSNIAGLLLARASVRAREFAVRAALGAGSGRLLGLVLAESAVLAFAGGVLGLALAYGGMKLLLLLAPEGAAAGLEPTLDIHVLVFCAATAILSGVLFGVIPAWRISRTEPSQTLKSGRSSTTERQGLRSVLVVAETALALILLVSAGLFLRSFVRLQSVSPGFNPWGVMTASFSLPPNAYPAGKKQAEFYRAVLGRLRSTHGVTAAALGAPAPFSGEEGSASFSIDGRAPAAGEPDPHGDIRFVTPGYFEALSIPLKSGRYFSDDDRVTSEPVAIIDENLARRYWPNEDPLGKKIKRGVLFTIVGVVGHVAHSDLAADNGRGAYYFTMFQRPVADASILVKTHGDTAPMAAAIREAFRAADPQQAVHSFRSMDDLVAASLAPRQFAMRLLSFFGAVALFLSALGLYGVISYSVTQRTREIGIRVALGASHGSVIGQVVAQGLRLGAIGVGLGMIGAVLCGRLLASQLFGVTPFDPFTLAAMAAALLAAAFFASYLPARRAAGVDPVTALRDE